MPPPPPGVDATPPDVAPGTSQRQASLDRIADDACGACHSRFDPFGHAFDVFDATGAFREEDLTGNAVEGSGLFLRRDSSQDTFRSVDEFTDILSSTDRAQACVVRKAAQYAWGRPLISDDGCTVVEIMADYAERGGRYSDLVLAIVTHPSFRSAGTEGSR